MKNAEYVRKVLVVTLFIKKNTDYQNQWLKTLMPYKKKALYNEIMFKAEKEEQH